MTEEARSVVKNNKLLQYLSGESADPGTSKRKIENERDRKAAVVRERKREREKHTACLHR